MTLTLDKDGGRLDSALSRLVPELTRSRILENLRAVQIRNNLKPSDALAGPGINLRIEMETGTGKSYTYVKTM